MVAFLGLGLLGSAFVRAMLGRGETVHVWNRSPEKARVLEGAGARAFDDPEAAVRGAARVHVCLSEDDAVDDVLARAQGGFAPGVTVIDHTTTSAPGTAERARHWAAQGVAFLHAPVFMGPQNALDATGTMVASGDRATFEAVKPALEAMTGRLVYAGPQPERAAGLKLIGNLFFIALSAGIADAFALGRALGIDAGDVAGLLKGFDLGMLGPARIERLQAQSYDDPSWNLAMARKDTRLMIEQAARRAVPLTVMPAIAEEMDRWLAAGHAGDDWSIITKEAFA